MRSLILKNYKLAKNVDLIFIKIHNLFILKNIMSIILFFLPSSFFYKIESNQISFIFLKNFYFKSFISHFFSNYLNLNMYILLG